jgi:glycosyltransferase involved in cell wall biosynthesis
VLEALCREVPGRIEVTSFGCPPEDLARLTDDETLLARHRGLLSRQAVAELLGESDVFLDLSMYQAFGRTALEAMACGATAVVPRLGGVWEFLEHEGNGLAVDAFAPAEAFDALVGLIGAPDRLRALQANALATGKRYSIMRAAASEYLLFSREHERRFGVRAAA